MSLLEKSENWEKDLVVCDYAKKLIDKLTCLNSVASRQLVDIETVKKAIYYAKKYHGDQKRQSGEPFYSHPLEVAYMVSDYLFRTDIIVTAVLHDTIEDTDLTKEKIAQEFGTEIANQVMDLTRIKKDGIKISSAAMVELLYAEKKYDVLLIKLFDRLHNMQTISAKSPAKIKKIVAETVSRFLSLSIYFKIPDIAQILLKVQSNITKEHEDKNQNYDKIQLPSLRLQSKIPRVHTLLSLVLLLLILPIDPDIFLNK